MNPMSNDWMKKQVDVYNAIGLLDENGYLDSEERHRLYEDLLYTCITGIADRLYRIEKDGEDNVN